MTNRIAKPINIEIYHRLVKAFKTENSAEIARRLGVTPPSVTQWEKGFSAPTIDKLVLAASETGVTIDWLLTGKSERQPLEDEDFLLSSFYELYNASKKAETEDLQFIKDFIEISLKRLEKKSEHQVSKNEKSRPK